MGGRRRGGKDGYNNSIKRPKGRKEAADDRVVRPSVRRANGWSTPSTATFFASDRREREIRNSNSVPPVVVVGQLPDTALQGDWTGCEMERN